MLLKNKCKRTEQTMFYGFSARMRASFVKDRFFHRLLLSSLRRRIQQDSLSPLRHIIIPYTLFLSSTSLHLLQINTAYVFAAAPCSVAIANNYLCKFLSKTSFDKPFKPPYYLLLIAENSPWFRPVPNHGECLSVFL